MRFVITGAASGIGRATALLAAQQFGAEGRIALVDRSVEGLQRVADEVAELGANALTVVADLADPDQCASVIDRTIDSFGGLDALVSNAGINPIASLRELDVETYDTTFVVNTRPVWLLGKAAHPHLAKSGGAIVATASISATQATPPMGAYSASKAALVMLVQQMALEWGPDGIRCNLVSPGPTVSGMTDGVFTDVTDDKQRQNREWRESNIPLRRVGEADDIAQSIMFLTSRAAKQITGVNLIVDGGLSLALMPAVGGGSGNTPSG